MGLTPKRSLEYPEGTDEILLGDDVIQAALERLDDAAFYYQGTLAARAAIETVAGTLYYATDIGVVYFHDGTTWTQLGPSLGETPIGSIIQHISPIDMAPIWLLSDGRAVSRSTYSALWDLARMNTDGTPGATGRWGNGDGSTTFNLPDLRGRVSVSPDTMRAATGAAGRVAGATPQAAGGGAETRTLFQSNLPPHSHTFSGTTNTTGNHSHALHTDGSYGTKFGAAPTAYFGQMSANSGTSVGSTNTAGNHSHTISGNTGDGPGSSVPVSVMQPYLVVNAFIRVA